MRIESLLLMAKIEAIKIQVKGMEAANKQREVCGESMAYTGITFNEAADEIFDIIQKVATIEIGSGVKC